MTKIASSGWAFVADQSCPQQPPAVAPLPPSSVLLAHSFAVAVAVAEGVAEGVAARAVLAGLALVVAALAGLVVGSVGSVGTMAEAVAVAGSVAVAELHCCPVTVVVSADGGLRPVHREPAEVAFQVVADLPAAGRHCLLAGRPFAWPKAAVVDVCFAAVRDDPALVVAVGGAVAC